jgi:hypothetical protein
LKTIQFKNEFFKLQYQIRNCEDFQLNEKYSKLFGAKCKFVAIQAIILIYISIVVFFLTFGAFETIAYLDPNKDYSLILSIIWFILFMMSTYYALPLMAFCTLGVFVITLYMKYRFLQVSELFEVSKRFGIYQKF